MNWLCAEGIPYPLPFPVNGRGCLIALFITIFPNSQTTCPAIKFSCSNLRRFTKLKNCKTNSIAGTCPTASSKLFTI
ncbi:hypothetical protein AYI69_g4975 [Smittium culicis]|uniref:Uncharacterized protein n=1 Tax=Smittium culicis TaxID=133412 RepID=A0A1R1Y998_9FUNG|nr:hypothetical protein AYI69_g4975 [Smittium culicis]